MGWRGGEKRGRVRRVGKRGEEVRSRIFEMIGERVMEYIKKGGFGNVPPFIFYFTA